MFPFTRYHHPHTPCSNGPFMATPTLQYKISRATFLTGKFHMLSVFVAPERKCVVNQYYSNGSLASHVCQSRGLSLCSVLQVTQRVMRSSTCPDSGSTDKADSFLPLSVNFQHNSRLIIDFIDFGHCHWPSILKSHSNVNAQVYVESVAHRSANQSNQLSICQK